MYLIINPADFNKNYLMLSDRIKNNIMNDGHFYRLYYSDSLATSKGLFLGFRLKSITIEKYFNKLKCSFKKSANLRTITFIKGVEKAILEIMPERKNRTPVYRIEEQLNNDFIKIFSNTPQTLSVKKEEVSLLLKISGIWTDNAHFGVTFRFFFIRP